MGKLVYNKRTTVDIDDRTLAHLQHVFGDKLRRGEAFMFSWPSGRGQADGRVSIWVSRSSSLEFSYRGSRGPALNPHWMEALAITANSPVGLYVVPEPVGAGPAAVVA